MMSGARRSRTGSFGLDQEPRLAKRPRTHDGERQAFSARSYDDYHIAWICALPLELGAGQTMFDELHEDLARVRGDENSYKFGRIAGHNVVMACLPVGCYGTSKAAHVVKDITRTFGAIKWCLMVGIGGGIPSENRDIRLGDVVVGTKVIPYDRQKITEKGSLRTDGIRKPDSTLLSVLSRLKANHDREREMISGKMSDILDTRFADKKHYQHPGLPDQLFETGLNDLGVSSMEQIPREGRKSQTPRIHFGAIASGDSLMKNAKVRDELAKELDVVCFEMEATGIMDVMPCLPIRGISDYADARKNDEWQKYAAATAAAYAREFLETLSPLPERGPIFEDFDGNLQSETVAPNDNITIREIMDSLMFEQMNSRRENLKSKYRRTCEWLLSQPEYDGWLSTTAELEHKGFLWIKGKPGSGKSTIMKYAYEVEKKRAATRRRKEGQIELVASYFFFAGGGELEKSISGMYRTLLWQVFKCFEDLQGLLLDEDISATEAISLSRLEDLFASALERLGSRRATFFIDALDEGTQADVTTMIRNFQDLVEESNSREGRIRICFSSRHYPFIKPRIGKQVVLEDFPGHAKDIETFVNGNLHEEDPGFKESLSNLILEKAQGVFMWAVLVVDEVNKVYTKGLTREERLRELRGLPPDLHELFNVLLTRHQEDMDDFVFSSFWILFAARPLGPMEFEHALWITSYTYGSQKQTMPNSKEGDAEDRVRMRVISATKGLAEVTSDGSPRVQFIHESVRDFLRKEDWLRRYWPATVSLGYEASESAYTSESRIHDMLKLCCRQYLELAWTGRDGEDSAAEDFWEPFTFLKYACQNVLHHANGAAHDILQGDFLKDLPLNLWTATCNHFEKHKTRQYPLDTAMIYILADRGHAELIRGLPSLPPLEFRCKGRFRYPLLAAAARCSADTVTALLGYPAADRQTLDIWSQLDRGNHDIGSCEGRTPLAWAAQEGSVDIVQLLLSQGADVNAGRVLRRHALMVAASHGQKKTLEVLLAAGADVNASVGGDHDNALQAASRYGHKGIVDLLLEKGADVNAQGSHYGNALQNAAASGFKEIVKLLLEEGADVNAQGGHYGNALQAAAIGSNKGIVKLLLEKGADVNAQGGHYGNALRAAEEYGCTEIVGILLAKGAVRDP